MIEIILGVGMACCLGAAMYYMVRVIECDREIAECDRLLAKIRVVELQIAERKYLQFLRECSSGNTRVGVDPCKSKDLSTFKE